MTSFGFNGQTQVRPTTKVYCYSRHWSPWAKRKFSFQEAARGRTLSGPKVMCW